MKTYDREKMFSELRDVLIKHGAVSNDPRISELKFVVDRSGSVTSLEVIFENSSWLLDIVPTC